jgi:hypothetical protein
MLSLYKTVLIALTLSLNAQADIFGDVGDWVKNNKTVTAVIGVGALTAYWFLLPRHFSWWLRSYGF